MTNCPGYSLEAADGHRVQTTDHRQLTSVLTLLRGLHRYVLDFLYSELTFSGPKLSTVQYQVDKEDTF